MSLLPVKMKTYFLKSYFNNKTRSKTWKKLATMLQHHIGERQALIMLRDRYAARKHPLAEVFESIIGEINKGHTLDVALYPWIPHEEVMLLRGGHKSARVVEALRDCVALIEARSKITGSLVSAVSYPLLLAGLFLVLLLTVALYVVPELSLISDPETWDGAAAAMYGVCSFVASPAGLISLLVVCVAVVMAILSLPYWTGRWRVRFDNFPPWSIYRLITGSVWLFTVATLLRANIQLDFILSDMLDGDVLQPWLRERVSKIKERYQIEGNFGTLLLDLKMNFPDQELVEDLAVYASLPDFHKNMYLIAKSWLDEGVERIGAQAQILNTGLLVCILAVLCGIGVAIGSMQANLQNSMGGM